MRHSRASFGLAALALLGACDVPTSMPIYDTVWNVPVSSTSISVNSFLPSQITATPDNSAFQVTVSPSSATIVRSLNQDCAACAAANGITMPKPSFSGGGTTNFALPATVGSATLVRDTLTVTISNGFNFDPLRPSSSTRGYLTLVVRNGAATVGRDSLDGATVAMPASGTVVRKIPLSGTITGGSGLQISSFLNSPVGDPVLIDGSRTISVSGSAGLLFVSSAQVSLANQSVSSQATTLNLSGIDSSVSKHAGGATLLLTVNNPFGASGNLSVKLVGGSTVSKQLALAPGATTPSVTFTQSEIRSLLGQNVSLSFDGTVSGANVTVTPGQTVSVAARLQITVNMGGSN